MKLKLYLAAPLVCAFLTSCAGTTRIATDTIGAGAGAFAGNALGKGNPLITAAGAVGGVLLGETLNYASDTHARKALVEGYNKGRSDAVKQQYWLMVDQQKDAPNQEPSISLYDVPLPEQQVDGVILTPRTATLRIEE